MYCCPTRCTVMKEYLIFNGQDGGLEIKSHLEAQLILLLQSWGRVWKHSTLDVSYLASKPI